MGQKLIVLILKGQLAMVFVLILNIMAHSLQMSLTN